MHDKEGDIPHDETMQMLVHLNIKVPSSYLPEGEAPAQRVYDEVEALIKKWAAEKKLDVYISEWDTI